jgi:hypothetical protein
MWSPPKPARTVRNFVVKTAYDRILELSPSGYWNRLQLTVLNLFRRAYLKFGGLLIKCELASVHLFVRLSHDLPLVMRLFPYFGWNLARICESVQQKYTDLTLADTGVNIGDTVAIVRTTASCPILCVEGDDLFYSILEKNLLHYRDVASVKAFLGYRSSNTQAREKKEFGTAHVLPTSPGEEFIETIQLSEVLAARPRCITLSRLGGT